MTEKQIQAHKESIDLMSQMQMASLRRFAPVGHVYFRTDLPLSDYFEARFKELGGITPEISKAIGWQ